MAHQQRLIRGRRVSSDHGVLHVVLLAAGILTVAAMGTHAEEPRRPREPLTKLDTLTRPSFPAHLVVKFRDDMRVRADFGGLRSLTAADLSLPDAVRAQHGLTFEPLIRLPQATLDFLEKTAAERSGTDQPDLAGMMVVFGPDAAIEQAANELLALDELEWAQFSALDPELPGSTCSPPCSDIDDDTSDLQFFQGWRGGSGVNLLSLHNSEYGPDAKGAGIQIADVEQSYMCGHEDLCTVNLPIEPSTVAEAQHGLAALGILAAMETKNAIGNQFGCVGAAADAGIWLFSELPDPAVQVTPQSRATAIAAATSQLLSNGVSGDVQLYEIQTLVDTNPSGDLRFGAPAEIVADVFTLTKLATDAGVVVVAAAGNNTNDLDGAAFAEWRNWGDSGAIIVGGGSPDAIHRYYLGSHGARVNVQAWADDVLTLGSVNGVSWNFGGPDEQYTNFNGTSSASAIVAGVAAAMQSLADTQFACGFPAGKHQRLSPLQMRNLLINTGQPQGAPTTNHIGPIPNALAAADEMVTLGIADNNSNSIEDICDIWAGTEPDCNGNLVIDSVDITSGAATDSDGNGIPDDCDAYGACCERELPLFPPTYSCSDTTSGLCCQLGGNFVGVGTKCATTDCATLPQ